MKYLNIFAYLVWCFRVWSNFSKNIKSSDKNNKSDHIINDSNYSIQKHQTTAKGSLVLKIIINGHKKKSYFNDLIKLQNISKTTTQVLKQFSHFQFNSLNLRKLRMKTVKGSTCCCYKNKMWSCEAWRWQHDAAERRRFPPDPSVLK